MFGIQSANNTLVIIAPHTTFLACIWIQKGSTALFSVAAYKQYICTHFQIGRGILFNLSWIESCIKNFLSHYSLYDSYIAIMPDRISTPHGFVYTSERFPAPDMFNPYYIHNTECGTDYIYTNEEYKHVYYWYQIPRILILQYQYIAIAAHLNCIRITPRFIALLHAYKALHGSAFRTTQLHLDLQKTHNSIARYFTIDSTRRLVSGVSSELYSNTQTVVDIIGAAGIAYLYQDHI
jgi:hypothetical protein